MTAIVVFNPQAQNPTRKGPLDLGGAPGSRLTLKPGRNELPDEAVKTLSEHPAFKGLQALGAIQILATQQTDDTAIAQTEIVSLAGLSIPDAKVAIAACTPKDKDALNRWLNAETRNAVVQAIQLRINQINAP